MKFPIIVIGFALASASVTAAFVIPSTSTSVYVSKSKKQQQYHELMMNHDDTEKSAGAGARAGTNVRQEKKEVNDNVTTTADAIDIGEEKYLSDDSILVAILQPMMRDDSKNETPLEATERVIELIEKACKNSRTTGAMDDHDNGDGDGDTDNVNCYYRTNLDSSAKKKKVDLILLPELCPVGYSEDTFSRFLPRDEDTRRMYRQIDDRLQEVAKKNQCAICYGTIGWEVQHQEEEGGGEEGKGGKSRGTDDVKLSEKLQYYIRQNVIDASGVQIASYDKIHLCDYGDCAETRFFTKGSKVTSFVIKNWKFGLLICADIRYPLLSRTLTQAKEHKVDALLQPACFIRDISFRTWQSFRETRAVENGVYFFAGNYAGEDFGDATFVPPWVDDADDGVNEPISLSTGEGYLLAKLDRDTLDHARSEFPFYRSMFDE